MFPARFFGGNEMIWEIGINKNWWKYLHRLQLAVQADLVTERHWLAQRLSDQMEPKTPELMQRALFIVT